LFSLFSIFIFAINVFFYFFTIIFMSHYNKNKGNQGEYLVLEDYLQRNYQLIEKNFQLWWGELDLILRYKQEIVFVEVKVVDYIEDLFGYISPNKLKNLKKTIEAYLLKHKLTEDFRLDVVFVKNQRIIEKFEGIEWSL